MTTQKYDYQKNLSDIREALRRNDYNTVIIEVFKFFNHPISQVNDENTKYILEFESLITEDREIIFAQLSSLYQEKKRIITNYKQSMVSMNINKNNEGILNSALNRLCDHWDTLYTCKTSRTKSRVGLASIYDRRYGGQIQTARFVIYVTESDSSEDFPIFPSQQQFELTLTEKSISIKNLYDQIPYDEDGNPPYENLLHSHYDLRYTFNIEYKSIYDAIKAEKEFIIKSWDNFIKTCQQANYNAIAEIEEYVALWRTQWLGGKITWDEEE